MSPFGVENALREQIVTELADVQEVLDALMVVCALEPSEVEAADAQRREERGVFNQRINLL